MKIEVWSDYICPFCYIGKRRLENALDQFEYKDEVELIFKSFELNPNAEKKMDGNIHQIIAKKYGISVEQAKVSNNQYVVSGAQPPELFLEVLDKVKKEEVSSEVVRGKNQDNENANEDSCSDGKCEI